MSAGSRARRNASRGAWESMFAVFVVVVVKIGVNSNGLGLWRYVPSNVRVQGWGVCIVTSFPSGDNAKM